MTTGASRPPETPNPLFHGLTLAWAATAAAVVATVAPNLLWLAAVWFGGLVVLVLTWLVCAYRRLRRWLRGTPVGPREAASWAVPPVVAVLVALATLTRAPLVVRVLLSDSALHRMAHEALPEGGRAGLMFVGPVEVAGDAELFQTDTGFLFYAQFGLAYSHTGAEPTARFLGSPTEYCHLWGRWWTFATPMSS